MSDAHLKFATGDTITLDASAGELDTAGYDGTSTGSYLSGSLSSAISGMSHGLSLSDLGTLGVDVIDIGGSSTNALLHIHSADTQAMSDAHLKFATGDTITLDITADNLGGTGHDGSGSGSYLVGTLDSALGNVGLSLSGLVDLGVSVVDIGGSTEAATLHISQSDLAAMTSAGLSFAAADDIHLDGTDHSGSLARSYSSTTTAEKLASAVGDSLGLHAMGIDQVEADGGVMVTLHQDADFAFGADHSLKDLLMALGDSGVTADDMVQSQDAVSAVAVSGDANFAIDDAMVSALLDAGLMTVNTASTIEVDTDAEHLSTSLKQLADIGVDKVVTTQDVVYVDLGDHVSDVDALSVLLSNLAADNVSTKFVQTDGEAVTEVGLVLTSDQAGLASAIESNSSVLDQLTSAGITELLVACDDTHTTVEVTLLGQDYYKVPVAG